MSEYGSRGFGANSSARVFPQGVMVIYKSISLPGLAIARDQSHVNACHVSTVGTSKTLALQALSLPMLNPIRG